MSEQTRRNRIAGARKAAAVRKARADAPPPERGIARGDYSPRELLDRIRARGESGAS